MTKPKQENDGALLGCTFGLLTILVVSAIAIGTVLGIIYLVSLAWHSGATP